MAVCQRYAGNREGAEDMLHDAFLKIFDTINSFRWNGDGSLRAWMERVTTNVAVDDLRSSNLLSTISYDYCPYEPADEPDANIISQLPAEVLTHFISQLPDGYRVVFNLYYIDGYTHKEIARMLNIKEKSSSSQLTRAKALLATRIKNYINEEL